MRLIDADALLNQFRDEPKMVNGQQRMGYAVGVGYVRDIIEAAPTIEAERIVLAKQCGVCDNTDGNVYTSMPPKVRCKITGEFHGYADLCTVEVEPVKRGRWEPHPSEREWDVCSICHIGTKRREYGLNDDGTEWVTEQSYTHCPWCGAKMSEGSEE